MEKFRDEKLLLMGSILFNTSELPIEVKERIDKPVDRGMTIIVGEARGPSLPRLLEKERIWKCGGHAKSLRYNAGNWKIYCRNNCVFRKLSFT